MARSSHGDPSARVDELAQGDDREEEHDAESRVGHREQVCHDGREAELTCQRKKERVSVSGGPCTAWRRTHGARAGGRS